MRLLQRSPSGGFRLQQVDDDHPPPYAILSHCWIHDQEITYEELQSGTGTNKTGFEKLRFCCDRATEDGLEYCWIDTCCINKKNDIELSIAINSMFRWYQHASRCYVYLSDVSVPEELLDPSTHKGIWKDAFCQSRWFTRGWTLQELIAPATVDFFSQERKYLGSRVTLEQEIHAVTSIPIEVLRGEYPTTSFTVEQRMSWADGRTTTFKEDKVYCLLGLFGVYLPLIYGEGKDYATQRLKDEIERRRKGTAKEQVQDLPVVRLLPFPRNKKFVGRDSELRQLDASLLSPTTHQRTAVHGLGGCGKSALALEFAYRTIERFPGHSVFWVPAISQESIELTYREIGNLLRIPGAAEENVDIRSLVNKALSSGTGGRWLMIIDNADDSEVLLRSAAAESNLSRWADDLPYGDRGIIVFTSRNRKVASDLADANTLELKDMSEDDAKQLLAQRLTTPVASGDKSDNRELLKLLTHLPLAIVQAVAFMNKNGTTVPGYLELLQNASNESELFSKRFDDATKYRDLDSTIAKTWHISFDHIRRKHPLAAEYLSLIACLDRTNIPQSLLAFKGSAVEQIEALGTLTGYAFLTERQQATEDKGGDRYFDMHRLVHLASAWWLDGQDQRKVWATIAFARLKKLVPDGVHEKKNMWTSYLPHAMHVARLEDLVKETDRATLLHRLGRCQAFLGQWASAVTSHQQALSLREEALGPDDADTLKSMANVAVVLEKHGSYAEAEAANRQLLARYEKLPVPEDWTLTISASLATMLTRQGKYGEAEKLLREILDERELLGPEEARLDALGGLAHVLEKQGNLVDSEKLYREVLEKRQKMLGLDHPMTLSSVFSLAGILNYGSKASTTEAEAMYRRVLADQERMLGPEHPSTLSTLCNIAGSLNWLGNGKESQGMYRHVLAKQSEVLGPEHPITLMTMYNLACVLNQQGAREEAEKLHLQTWTLREKMLGPEHPDTLMSGGSIGLILFHQKRYEESTAVFRKIYAGYLAVYGLNHVFSRRCLYDYMDAMWQNKLRRRDLGLEPDWRTSSTRSSSRESRLRRGLAKMRIGGSKSSAG